MAAPFLWEELVLTEPVITGGFKGKENGSVIKIPDSLLLERCHLNKWYEMHSLPTVYDTINATV